MLKTKEKREYYILAGDKGLKELLIEKGINISSTHLLIVKEYSRLGKLIKKELKQKLKGAKNNGS